MHHPHAVLAYFLSLGAVLSMYVASPVAHAQSETSGGSALGQLYPGDDALCGVSCLYIAARLLQKEVVLEELAKAATVTEAGCSLLDLKRAAQGLNLEAAGFFSEDRNWQHLHPLTIAHVGDNHFVLVLNVSANGVQFADPVKGIRRLSCDAFSRWWSGHALRIDRPGSPSSPTTTQQVSVGVGTGNTLTAVDLGEMLAEDNHRLVVVLLNAGPNLLTIGKVTSTCGCTTATPENKSLVPSDSVALPITIATRGLEGPFDRSVVVPLTGDQGKENVIIRLTGRVRGDGRLVTYPPALTYAAVAGETLAPARLIVRRLGGGSLAITGATVTVANMSMEVPEDSLRTLKSDRLELFVVPPAGILPGEYRGSVTLRSQHPVYSSLEVPLKITIRPNVVGEPSSIVAEGTVESIESARFIVRLRSVSGESVRPAAASLEPKGLGTATLVEHVDGPSVEVRLRAKTTGGGIVSGALRVQANQAHDINIPVRVRVLASNDPAPRELSSH